VSSIENRKTNQLTVKFVTAHQMWLVISGNRREKLGLVNFAPKGNFMAPRQKVWSEETIKNRLLFGRSSQDTSERPEHEGHFIDCREQFPISREITLRAADAMQIRRPSCPRTNTRGS
jgi:hypothetical protein